MATDLNHVGFSFSKSKLQLVEVVKKTSKYFLENVDEHIFETEINFNSGSDEIIDILQNAFNSLTERNSLKSKNISFALPPEIFSLFTIPVEPSLTNEELSEHISWEFSILFPNKNFRNEIVRTMELSSGRILVITVARKFIELLFEFSKRNGLKLRFVDLQNFTSDVFINSGNKKTLSFYFDDTNLICSSYIQNKLSDFKIFELENINSIPELAESYVEENNIAYDSFVLSSILDSDEIRNELTTKLNLEIESYNPFDNIELSESFIQNGYYLNTPTLFASAAGICFRKF